MSDLPSFDLWDDNVVLVAPVRNSGFVGGEEGLWVIDEESDLAYKTSMLVEVIAKQDTQERVKLGGVYVVPVYAWDTISIGGYVYQAMHIDNLQAEVENFYEDL